MEAIWDRPGTIESQPAKRFTYRPYFLRLVSPGPTKITSRAYLHTYLPTLVHLGRTCGTKNFYPMCLSMYKYSDDDTWWLVLDGRTGGW